MSRTIVSTVILVEWSDKPKMETLLHEMPDDLRQSFDEWLSDIEEEDNCKLHPMDINKLISKPTLKDYLEYVDEHMTNEDNMQDKMQEWTLKEFQIYFGHTVNEDKS